MVGRRIVGVFGVPTLHEDDALRAAQAALAAKDALEAEAAVLEERGLALSMRVGLATGEALVGGPEPSGFAGDAVGQADELAQRAAAGEILVGDQTRRLAAAALEVEPAGGGRFRLLAAPIGARPLPVRLDAPLVGRDEELGRLRDGLARAVRDGGPVLATVLGEAGIGKTRLVHELAAQVAAEATVLTGRCLPYGDGITFWPLRELVAQAGAPQGTAQELEALLEGEEDAARVAEWLAGALGRGGPGTAGGAPGIGVPRRIGAVRGRWPPRRSSGRPAGCWRRWPAGARWWWSSRTCTGPSPPSSTWPRPSPPRPGRGCCWCAWPVPSCWSGARAGPPGCRRRSGSSSARWPRPTPGHCWGRWPGRPRPAQRLLEVAAGNPLFLEQLAASLGEQHWGEDEPQLPGDHPGAAGRPP